VGDGDDPATLDRAEVGRIFGAESGRSVATLIGVFGDIDLAEDAVQEAFVAALGRWPADGLPPNPGGLDHHHRPQPRHRPPAPRVARPGAARRGGGAVARRREPGMPEEPGTVPDDRLRLIFTCCHPALSTQTQVALTLRLLGGLSTTQVAGAFLVAEATMARRVVRAKHRIKAARIPYRVPADHQLPGRMRPVLAVVYLVYTAGLTDPADPGLCAEPVRLARILATLLPDEPEVGRSLPCTTSCSWSPRPRSWPSTGPSPSARSTAPPPRSLGEDRAEGRGDVGERGPHGQHGGDQLLLRPRRRPGCRGRATPVAPGRAHPGAGVPERGLAGQGRPRTARPPATPRPSCGSTPTARPPTWG
jgi:DNA-directed RNA polymerase specialized sigma24 family protein